MKVSVNQDQAYEIILSAISEAKSLTKPKSEQWSYIKSVILGTHLTYRYILITGLLAKATNQSVNPLALQANAPLDGAYDARSLCHSVIVGRVENIYLDGKLGASNEPFLNKPARYLIHSTQNPVRKGNDKAIQQLSISILQSATTQANAYDMLVDTMYFTLQRSNRIITPTSGLDFDFQSLIYSILENPCDGESCAIVSALSLILLAEKNGWQLKVHPVNQAGSSSKETLDIDVYQDDKPLLSLEIKDKVFNFQDVNHASSKASAAGVSKIMFLKGPRAIGIGFTEDSAIEAAAKQGVSLCFSSVTTFAMTCYSLSNEMKSERMIECINSILRNIRAKDSTVDYISSLLSDKS